MTKLLSKKKTGAKAQKKNIRGTTARPVVKKSRSTARVSRTARKSA